MFYVYLLQSEKDGKWYTGVASDLRKRLSEHNNGEVFSTKNRGPFRIIYFEACLNSKDAFTRERYLKSGPGKRYLKNRLRRFLSLTGFTILEMVVVIGIVILLSAFAVAWGSRSQSQSNLNVAAVELGQAILRAKSLAAATYGRTALNDPCGYGVRIYYPNPPVGGTGAGSYELFKYSFIAPPPGSRALQCEYLGSSDPKNPSDNSSYTSIDVSASVPQGQGGASYAKVDSYQISDFPAVKLDSSPVSAADKICLVFFLAPDLTTLVEGCDSGTLQPSGNLAPAGPSAQAVHIETTDGASSIAVKIGPTGEVTVGNIVTSQ